MAVRLRPFLKWVGGKRQLLPVLRRFYPDPMGRYFEPFVGSGADLIACYRRVRRSLDEVATALEGLAADHSARGRECYMQVRDGQFNPMRAAWRERGADLDDYPADLAAMLIYLNRTGYNGLFRLNASGEFNVPPGRYDSPKVIDRPLLARVSEVLASPWIRIEHAAFDRVLHEAGAGDFVYFDPPYAPLSATANFRGYTGRGFSDADQERLQRALITLAARGVQVLLSNSVAPSISRLYEDNKDVAAAGLHSWRFPARRAINSRPDRRGAVEELVVSNVTPRAVAS